jgi:Uma2 family endonuclease
MGWLIDPQEKSVLVYRPDQSPQVYDEPETRLPMPAFAKEFALTVENLFNWLVG